MDRRRYNVYGPWVKMSEVSGVVTVSSERYVGDSERPTIITAYGQTRSTMQVSIIHMDSTYIGSTTRAAHSVV